MADMKQLLARLHKLCETHRILLFCLLILVILRLPNFFEPYWYGDEGIYLTIGNALRGGEHLYRDIVDHKTPIIYYLAMVPNQLSFRILNLIWMLITTTLFYFFAKRFLKRPLPLILTLFTFVIFTTIPRLEGNLPNGELFVMGFIFVALTLMSRVPYIRDYLDDTEHKTLDAHVWPTIGWSLAAGLFASLAVLTKVPALFDAAALGLFGWFTLASLVVNRKFAGFQKNLITVIKSWAALAIGFIVPIVVSIIYFALRGSLTAYLNFGLLYNFHYAGNWQLGTDSKILTSLFSLPGKAAVMVVALLTVTILVKKTSRHFQFLFGWFVLALFASLLSNRPYPHYFLQVLPPFILLLGWGLQNVFSQRKALPHFKTGTKFELVMVALAIFMVHGVKNVIGVYFYPTQSYYTRFWQLATKQISQDQYQNQFDSLVADNKVAATIIKKTADPKMFIWGTNPMLYAQTGTYPVGRFTVSFHIKDLGVEPETIAAVEAAKPQFIVTMNDETEILPGLNNLLNQEYLPNNHFDHYTLWMRQK